MAVNEEEKALEVPTHEIFYASLRFLKYKWIASGMLIAAAFFARAEPNIPRSSLGQPLFESGYTKDEPQRSQAASLLTQTVFDHGDPTDYEQLMLELINRARAAPGVEAARLGIDLNEGLAPGTISDTPKQPLSFHPLLINAARAHSQWMLDNNIFSHTGVDDSTPGQRMQTAGYVFSGSWAWGENIAWSGSTGAINVEQQARNRHDGLFLSPGHRTNICSDWFDEMGLGLVSGVFTDQVTDYNALMVTQKYTLSGATPGPRVVGVVYSDTNQTEFYDIGEGMGGITVSVDGGAWQAITSASGGYALPYEGSGDDMTITFNGGNLPRALKLKIAKTGENIKVDVETLTLTNMVFTSMDGSQAAMAVHGPRHLLFELQHSTNLVNWITVSTNVFASDPQPLQHEPESASAVHFYRLIWAE